MGEFTTCVLLTCVELLVGKLGSPLNYLPLAGSDKQITIISCDTAFF